MDFLATAKLILSLLPTLISTVQMVEQLLPAQSTGAQKLELVKQTLSHANSVSTNAVADFEAVWPAIAGTVGALVNTFNATGVFKKAAPAVAPVVTH